MKTKEEIKDWLLENAVDEDGNLDLCYLDFSSFNGDVYISNMKVQKNLFQYSQEAKGNLWQCDQKTQGNLYQSYQKVGMDLFQDAQEAGRDLFQYGQEAKGEFLTQTLKDDEEYKIDEYNDTYIVKKEKGN
ncbi:MAG: hypothetical protein RRY22_04205 [Bacilli bacterium]